MIFEMGLLYADWEQKQLNWAYEDKDLTDSATVTIEGPAETVDKLHTIFKGLHEKKAK